MYFLRFIKLAFSVAISVLILRSCCHLPLVDCGPEIGLLKVANDTIVLQKETIVLFKAFKYERRKNHIEEKNSLSMHLLFTMNFQSFNIEYDTTEIYLLINEKKVRPISFGQLSKSKEEGVIELRMDFTGINDTSLVSPGIKFCMNNIKIVSASDTTTFRMTNQIFESSLKMDNGSG